MEPELKVSVVVPTYNGAERVGNCIEALLKQKVVPHQIIVVSDHSKDNTEEVVSRYPTVKFLKLEENSGAGGARIAGAKKATSDLIAFTDDDCVPPRDWTHNIVNHFLNDEDLGGIGGRYIHEKTEAFQDKLAAVEEGYGFHVFSKTPEHLAPCGGNSAYRKSVWNAQRTWREVLHFKGMGSGEDSVVGSEIMKHSKVRFLFDLTNLHQSKENGGYFKRHFNRGYSRTSIIIYDMTHGGDSKTVFKFYGGAPLFLSTVFLSIIPFSFFLSPVPMTAGVAISCVFLHLFLSHDFFRFVKKYETEQLNEAPSVTRRLAFRFMLVCRSFMWALGALKGVGFYLKYKISRNWNIICSVLHFWRPRRISKLFYFVTSQCNARCHYCFNLENVVNWKARKPDELSLEEVIKVAKGFGRLPYITLSGGEPFIRPDVVDVIEAFYTHSKTQWVTIPTNAALTKRVVSSVKEILNRCPGIFLTLQASLDSLDEDHNKSRALKNGFDKMCETLKELAPLRKVYPNLRIQIATCYDTFNLHRMDEIIEFCKKHFEYDQQIFYLIRKAHELTTPENNHLIKSYVDLLTENEERERKAHRQTLWSLAVRALQGIVYRDMIKIKLADQFLRPCYATQKFATLWDDGKVSPCEILEKTELGNLKDFNYSYYELKQAQKVNSYHQKEIVKKNCNCDWMCALPINMLYDTSTYKDIAKELISPTTTSHVWNEI